MIEAISPSHSAIIAGYAPIRQELDVRPALTFFQPRHVTALPVIDPASRILSFRRFQEPDVLLENRFGIREPGPDAQAVIPDIVLVPLLAFDPAGHRLGYGAGYYDHTLAALRTLKPVIAIGVAFSFQQEASLPSGPHDERLDMIATEAEIRML